MTATRPGAVPPGGQAADDAAPAADAGPGGESDGRSDGGEGADMGEVGSDRARMLADDRRPAIPNDYDAVQVSGFAVAG